MFNVYLLYSEKFNKTYIGYSSDVELRLQWHNELSERGWTKKYRPWKIIYLEEYGSKSEALQREKYFKTGVGREKIQQILNEYLQNMRS